jgi:hypothetical protein
MPKAWVKDYVKQILIDAAECWILAKHKASGTNRVEVIKAVTEDIKAAMDENNDAIRDDLELV